MSVAALSISQLQTPKLIQNILVVDDNPDILTFLDLGLSDHWNVFQASDGVYVQKMMQRHDIDLVILDILMPRQEGLETLMQLRSRYAHVPVIMISVDDYYLNLSLEFGAHFIHNKPIDLSLLTRQIIQIQNS